MRTFFTKKLDAVAGLLIASLCLAQAPEANYDETKVSQFTLPDPLVMANGQRVGSARAWQERRRPEVLRLFETYVYGRSPGRLQSASFGQPMIERNALGGKAVRKVVSVYFSPGKSGPKMDILIYLPRGAKYPVPLFLGLNFAGNQAVHSDPGITLFNAVDAQQPGTGHRRASRDGKLAGEELRPVAS